MSRGLDLKKRGGKRGKLVCEKFGMNPGRTETAPLHRNGHNSFHRRNLDVRLLPLERRLPELHITLKNLLKPSPGGGEKEG